MKKNSKHARYVVEAGEDLPFHEADVRVGFRVRRKWYEGRSPYQKIQVFDLAYFGRTLFLDGILQTTERDEFIYHEMLCQVPLFLHPSPQKVLIIGGGDGGSLEEVLKHKGVQETWMVEIDGKVVEVSKKYLPSISKNAFSDKRAKLRIEDGWKYLKGKKNEFDVIILDLSDPDGPAKSLISLPFYRDVKKALKKDGIVSVQSGSFTTQPELVAAIAKRLQKLFDHVEVRRACVPAYQSGEYTFTTASESDISVVSQKVLEKRFAASKLNLKYWSPAMHEASSILPAYLAAELK